MAHKKNNPVGRDREKNDKFFQPIDAIEIVSRAKEPRSLLPEEIIETGRERGLAGEDVKEVSLDLEQLDSSELSDDD
jgi:hypothetical protein